MKRFACAVYCALFAATAFAECAPEIAPFSNVKPSAPLSAEWKHVPLASFKNNTEYTLVTEDGAVVVPALTHNAASLLATKADTETHAYSLPSWRWEVKQG